jgi:hypothetical protein
MLGTAQRRRNTCKALTAHLRAGQHGEGGGIHVRHLRAGQHGENRVQEEF